MTPKLIHASMFIMVMLMGAMLLFLGGFTLISPEILERYGFSIETAEARIAARAVIGGGEIGLGLVLMFGGWLKISLFQRLVIAVILFTCVVLVRLTGIMLEGDTSLSPMVYRELFAEIIILALMYLCLLGHVLRK